MEKTFILWKIEEEVLAKIAPGFGQDFQGLKLGYGQHLLQGLLHYVVRDWIHQTPV